MRRAVVLSIIALLLAAPQAGAQSVRDLIRRVEQTRETLVETVDGFRIGPKEEAEIGAQISEQLRERFGVVQDAELHRYVTLVGRSVAAGSDRRDISWTFVVLDTDGVNAFSAPGGFIHITRGALALIRSEAELAAVLGHEIGHVEKKHALAEIRRSRAVSLGRNVARAEAIARLSEAGLNVVRGNLWDQKQEMESDRMAVELADTAGYTPAGLGNFLTRLMERNHALRDSSPTRGKALRNGLFSSHPEMEGRLQEIDRAIQASRLSASALVRARYEERVQVTALSVEELSLQIAAQSRAGVRGPNDGAGGFDLLSGGLTERPDLGTFSSRQEASVAYARNLDIDSDAPGGPNAERVHVTIAPGELAEFRRGIRG